jgi:hypothetical protein
MDINTITIFKQALQSAETIFLHPSITYPYEDIIQGVSVNGSLKKAVGVNTTQAFGRKLNYGNFGENKIKAMDVCDEFFLLHKNRIIDKLNSHIRTRNDMDVFEHELFKDLGENLLQYSTPSMIGESYNRIRKPIELYLEHIVAMADEIDNETRKILTPLLFLPIDRWIMGSELIFDDFDIYKWDLTRKSSFGMIRTRDLFNDMQRCLLEKSKEISIELGKEFQVIYFDVFWGNRLNDPGVNLFGECSANDDKELKLPKSTAHKQKEKSTSYVSLRQAIADELKELDIESGREYRCRTRKNGEYIFETLNPQKRRKNIVTVWEKGRGGDIRIVGIGKYANQCGFDWADLGTDAFRANLREAYNLTV